MLNGQFYRTIAFYLDRCRCTEVFSLEAHKFEKTFVIKNSWFIDISFNRTDLFWRMIFVPFHLFDI